MNQEEVIKLYKKERLYQKSCFGEYEDINSLNLASFIIFIDSYLERAKKSYCGQWQKDLPSWLKNSKEMNEGSTPVNVYSELIKIFALVGATLETYSDIEPDEWRKNQEEDRQKWSE